jgi:hypothetical protein
MNGRTVLLVGAFSAVALAAPASASAGLTYGAIDTQGGHVWLKLRKDRKAVVSHEVEYFADCSDGDTWFGESSLGSEHGFPMRVRSNRFAAKTVEDAYDGAVTVEYRVSARVTKAAVTGQFTVNVTGSLEGSNFTCHAGPVRFKAVD